MDDLPFSCRGYMAPEYLAHGQLTEKADVYSFGVVFLEIITGRRVIDNSLPSEEQNLVVWVSYKSFQCA